MNNYQHSPDAPHPEWAECSRLGCIKAALYGYESALTVVHVCREHLPEGVGAKFMGDRWWESVPDDAVFGTRYANFDFTKEA